MKMRRIVSLFALLSFCLLVVTALVLYVAPQGRVAYWADWHMMGLDKDQWGAIHINTGMFFLIAMVLHIWLNFKPIVAYLSRAGRLRIFTPEFSVAAVISILLVAATLIGVPPVSFIQDLESNLKISAEAEYGKPPYGHAELSSLRRFCSRMGLDLAGVIDSLEKVGISDVNPDDSLKDIADDSDFSPQEIYRLIRR